MPENEQDTIEQKKGSMPEEFQRYIEATSNRRMQKPTTLDEKIELWTYLLEQWKYYLADSPHRKQKVFLLLPLLKNCSIFYLQRYQERKQREDLDRAIEFAQETIQNIEDGSPGLLTSIEHLGFVLGLRYNQTLSIEDLTSIDAAWQRAITSSTDNSSKSKYFYFLGQTYKEHYRLSKSHDALEQSIQYLKDAARLDTSATRNDPLNLLAFMLRERYSFTEDLNDLRRANLAWQESVSLLPIEDETIADKLKNIGAIQVRIYVITQQQSDLEENIIYWKTMLSRIPATMAAKAMSCNFLGYYLAMRFEFTHNLEDLNEALLVQEQAVALSVLEQEEYTDYLHNLHNMLTERYKVRSMLEDSERIRQIEEEIEQLKHEQKDSR